MELATKANWANTKLIHKQLIVSHLDFAKKKIKENLKLDNTAEIIK